LEGKKETQASREAEEPKYHSITLPVLIGKKKKIVSRTQNYF